MVLCLGARVEVQIGIGGHVVPSHIEDPEHEQYHDDHNSPLGRHKIPLSPDFPTSFAREKMNNLYQFNSIILFLQIFDPFLTALLV